MKHQDKINNAFISIIDNALNNYSCQHVIFANESGDSFVHSKSTPYLTIIFILKGAQNIFYYHDGKIVHRQLLPGQFLFIGVFCPIAFDWKLPLSRLGVVCDNQHIGVSWNSVTHPIEGQDMLPDLWFSSRLSVDSDLWYLLKALNGRDNYPSDSKLTRLLPELILIKLREIVLNQNMISLERCFDTFLKICHYLENNYNQPLSRKIVADIFKLNPDYVTRLFHKKGNILFSHYLRNLRLRKAEELLDNGNLTIQDISTLSGFSDSSYFIKVFRKKYNCSPGEYRTGKADFCEEPV